MGLSTFEMSVVEFAQELQVGLMEAQTDNRWSLVTSALTLLGNETSKLASENAKFLIDSNLAVNHRRWESDPGEQKLVLFSKIAVEGIFRDFNYVQVGRLINTRPPIQSLCLSLEDVTMLPDGDLLPEGDIMHFPVLAITQSIRAT